MVFKVQSSRFKVSGTDADVSSFKVVLQAAEKASEARRAKNRRAEAYAAVR
jgi:hypothetical protein